jgi:hypothetical protein
MTDLLDRPRPDAAGLSDTAAPSVRTSALIVLAGLLSVIVMAALMAAYHMRPKT